MTILYFAWVREAVGTGEERIDVPASIATVGALIDWLSDRSAGHAAGLADRDRLRVAIDQCFAGFDASIADAREVAIFPPVTGG